MKKVYAGNSRLIGIMKKPNEMVFKIELEIDCNTPLFKELVSLMSETLYVKISRPY